MVSALRALVAYPLIALSTLLFGGIAVVGSWLPPGWHVSDRAATAWARLFLVLAGVRFEVEGHEHVDPGRPQVVISNHLSNLDPMVHWLALQPLHYRFMAKKEIYKIPFFGTAVKAMHMVKVDRSAGVAGYEFINSQIRTVFDLGLSLMIYGEGTRSRTGHIKEFKKGPFIIAKAVDAPILPVTIEGTDVAWPPGAWRMHGGTVRVVIHPLVEQAGTPTQLGAQVEETIRTTYARLDAERKPNR